MSGTVYDFIQVIENDVLNNFVDVVNLNESLHVETSKKYRSSDESNESDI